MPPPPYRRTHLKSSSNRKIPLCLSHPCPICSKS